jgi:SAM-dependent methyltransferase
MASSLADRRTLLDNIIQFSRFRQVDSLIPDGCLLTDLGCGDGSFLRRIRDRVTAAYGIDMNVDHAHGSDKLKFLCGNLDEEIPLKTWSSDVVTALALIQHLSTPGQFVDEIHRILKPGGCCILTTPSTCARPLLEFLAYKLKVISEKDVRDNKNYFTKSQLSQLFSAFKSVSISPFQFGLNNLIVAVK